MKYCPNCQTRYTDDTLRFCLQDGTPLAEDSIEAPPTVAFGETETIVAPKQVEPLPTVQSETSAPNWGQNQTTRLPPQQTAPPKKSKTFLLVILAALGTLFLLGVGGIGAWLYLRNNSGDVVKNTAANNPVVNTNANVKSNVKTSPSPIATPKNDVNSNAVNTNVNSAPPKVDAEQVKKEVSSRVNSWVSLTQSRNINAYMNLYAPTVDYYNRRGVSSSAIRADKQRAFGNYDSIEMNISNLNVTTDASGESATAVFDKEWVFEGDASYSAGKVQSQLQLKKINGQWLITSERDLKVYYTE
ncbi:MAG TPA: hypothetical protein VF556_04725 [Pyrinomonadaceae bacterium]|jgi:hypothetical protein